MVSHLLLVINVPSQFVDLAMCATFSLDCIVYIGAKDMLRKALNVQLMELLGAKVLSFFMAQVSIYQNLIFLFN
ncbi:putative tryptophan synthase [Helianthus debilis subsp. tardiflorus]